MFTELLSSATSGIILSVGILYSFRVERVNEANTGVHRLICCHFSCL